MKRSKLQLEADSVNRVCIALSRLVHAKSEAERQMANRWVLAWEIHYAKICGIAFKTEYQRQSSTSLHYYRQESVKKVQTLASVLRRAEEGIKMSWRIMLWIFQRDKSPANRSQTDFPYLSVLATR
ncbi:MAG: hypothetical protein ACOYNZ_13555 [Rhodoferax sp.]